MRPNSGCRALRLFRALKQRMARRRSRPYKEKKYAIFYVGILAVSAVFGISIFLFPQRPFSENENRFLAVSGRATVKGWLDGTVQENLAEVAGDQFAGRDLWVKLAAAIQRAVGKKDIGGAYIGKDGFLFEKVLGSDLSEKRFLSNISCVEHLSRESGKKVSLMLVPSAGTVLGQFLPDGAVMYDADSFYRLAEDTLKETAFLDIRGRLLEASKKEQVYFRTDHHWTAFGAYEGYRGYFGAMKKKALPLDAFQLGLVSDSFYGTLYSKAPDFFTRPDSLWIPENLPELEVRGGGAENGIYAESKAGEKDKYAVYFGGNFDKIVVENKQAEKNKLLIVKDSFANSFVPFLIHGYKTVVMVDLRYFNDSFAALLEEENPGEVLVLYEMSSFARDENLYKLLK